MKTFDKHFKTILFTLVAILSFGFSASALPPVTWTNGSGDGKWSTASNWSSNSVPGSNRNVIIEYTYDDTIHMDINANVSSLTLSEYVILKIDTGNDLTIENNLNLLGAGHPALLASGNSNLTIKGNIYSDDDGILYMGSGTLLLGGNMSSNMQYNFEDATISFNGISGSQNITAVGIPKNVIINNADGVYMDYDLYISRNLTGTGTLYTNGNWIFIQGDINLAHLDAYNSNVFLWGTSVQHINCPEFYNLICANDGGVILDANTTIQSQLVFDPSSITSYSGPSCLHLNGYELTMNTGATFSGAALTNGFVVCEYGHIFMENDNSDEEFPIGITETVYTPVVINSSTMTSFNVEVDSGVTDANLNSVTSHALNATWKISPSSDANDFVAYLIYDTSKLELSGFDRNNFNIYERGSCSTPSPWTFLTSGNSTMDWGGETVSANIGQWTLTSGTHYFSFGDPATALPVELISFTAHASNGKNILEWNTASEINNDHFEIQRFDDSKKWNKIGEVAGHGTTNEKQFYSFTDASIQNAGILYYRLKQVDYNGKFEYSEIRRISSEKQISDIKVYPNPAKDILNVSFSNDGQNKMIKIFNVNGACIYNSENTTLQKQIDISSLTSGMYILKVYSANDVKAQVFCKE